MHKHTNHVSSLPSTRPRSRARARKHARVRGAYSWRRGTNVIHVHTEPCMCAIRVAQGLAWECCTSCCRVARCRVSSLIECLVGWEGVLHERERMARLSRAWCKRSEAGVGGGGRGGWGRGGGGRGGGKELQSMSTTPCCVTPQCRRGDEREEEVGRRGEEGGMRGAEEEKARGGEEEESSGFILIATTM